MDKTNVLIVALIILCVLLFSVFSLYVYVKCNSFITPTPHVAKEYEKAAYKVFQFFIDNDREWWPTEGTLIGMLRWGGNHQQINDGILATDTDIDIMVRVKNEKDWENTKQAFQNYILEYPDWTRCQARNDKIAISRNAKFTCHTLHNYGSACGKDVGIHVDIHSYMVDEGKNIVFMDQLCRDCPDKCKDRYPFQNWGGVAPYRGFIVDESGKFLKAKFLDMDVPCPFKYIDILGGWNNFEYGHGDDLHLPIKNCCLKSSNCWEYDGCELKSKDWEAMCKIAHNLERNGYASFSSRYPQKCPSFPKGTFECRHGRNDCFGKKGFFYDRTLFEFFRLHDKLKDIWFLTGGTLLGFARENNLLRNDDDVDMGFFASKDVFEKIERVFQEAGYKKKVFWLSTSEGRFPGQYTFSKKIGGFKIEFDVAPFWIDPLEKKYVKTTFFNKMTQYHYWDLFELSFVTLLGKVFRAPKDYNAFVESMYGKGWKNENSKFRFTDYKTMKRRGTPNLKFIK